jgi:lipopolysaccharide transport system ATP-binding protein
MSNTVIKVEHVSKQYRLGQIGTGTLSHDLNRMWASIRGKDDPYLKVGQVNDRTKTADERYVWALNDINFDVQQGDVVGIIGKNGAGKSTLLKILSRTTTPTLGQIKIKGRMASLLEVGTGFHYEMTGRENVYQNGAILGMRKAEITKKFDEIVDFAGVAKYIDTPVKRYSSGMIVRLAFAIAAHLEPEILIVDEVLAVGDAEFQRKCLGKMHDVASYGRTVLFVSHDIEAISSLCTKGVLLDQGTTKKIGPIHDIVKEYTDHYQDSFKIWDTDKRPGDNIVRLNKVTVVDQSYTQIFQANIDQTFGICIEFEIMQDEVQPTPNFHFYTSTNVLCFVAIAETHVLNKGTYRSIIWIPENLLNNQTYRVGVVMTTLKYVQVHLDQKEIINIEIIENKAIRKHDYGGQIPGTVRPDLKSEIKSIK